MKMEIKITNPICVRDFFNQFDVYEFFGEPFRKPHANDNEVQNAP